MSRTIKIITLLIIHCYAFSQKNKADTAAKQELEIALIKGIYLKKAELAPNFPKGYIPFKYINKYDYYENKARLKAIKKAEKSNNIRILNRWLTDYVSRFGTKNFQNSEDLEMIWKLGNIRELIGDTTGALFLYRIALTHNPNAFAEKKKHFEELQAPYFNEYVSLDFYYKILEKQKEIDSLLPTKGVLLKLPPHINTEYPEYAPYMHPRGDVLIFTRRKIDYENPNAPDPFNNEDLYYMEKSSIANGWNYPEKFEDEINSMFNEGSACLNASADEIIFVRCNAPDGFGSCDLYSARYYKGHWVDVKNLGKNVNSPAWDSHPSLSTDGRTLYFASNRNGGFGNVDIYMCEKQPNGSWGKAKNLGPIINTAEDDLTPFIHPVNNTLYFASSGHYPNFGGYDIYKARKIFNKYEIPKNLGPFINSEQDEFYFTISGQGDKIFFAKSEKDNPLDYDLYSYPMPMGARPDAIAKLNGFLIDSVSGFPLQGIITAIDLKEGIAIEPIYINDQGYFEFNLINNRKYLLLVLNYNAITIDEKTANNKDSLFALLDKSIINYKPVVFETFEFPPDEAKITKDMKQKLKLMIEYLNSLPEGTKITIEGHTDATGTPKYNLKLSKKRAEVIKDFILKNSNIKPNQIKAVGYGETRPVFPNDSEEHRAKNRRVEFFIETNIDYIQQKRLQTIKKNQAKMWFSALNDIEEIPYTEVKDLLQKNKQKIQKYNSPDDFYVKVEEESGDSVEVYYKYKRDTLTEDFSTEYTLFDTEFEVIYDIEALEDTTSESSQMPDEFGELLYEDIDLNLSTEELDESLNIIDETSGILSDELDFNIDDILDYDEIETDYISEEEKEFLMDNWEDALGINF